MKAASTTSEACAQNPSGPGCSQSASEKTSKDNAEALAKLSDANSAQPNYNVNDISGTNAQPSFAGAGAEGGSSAPTVKPMGGGGGGGMMGGSGGGGRGNGGILGGNGGNGLFGGSTDGKTDIDKGLRSGGYTTTPGSEEEKPDGGGFAGYEGRRGLASDGTGRLDLRQYLPGGALSADTLRAAAMKWQAMGIHPAHIDLWTRISEKIQQKCALGELFDCR